MFLSQTAYSMRQKYMLVSAHFPKSIEHCGDFGYAEATCGVVECRGTRFLSNVVATDIK